MLTKEEYCKYCFFEHGNVVSREKCVHSRNPDKSVDHWFNEFNKLQDNTNTMEDEYIYLEKDYLEFDTYERRAMKTAIYPNRGDNLIYPTLGLCGESGEIAEKLKKLIRDKDGVVDEEWKKGMARELGDVLWYITAIATELDITLEEVAYMNLDKLESRKDRGMLHGSGDNR
jgi:NTP pyrophosphatase (non-canonical NTP hydrolase)